MKSRRDSPSCFFFAILLPSEKQMGPGKLIPRMKEFSRPDDATARAGQSTGVARLLHICDLVPDHRADEGGKNYSPNAAFGGTSHTYCVCSPGYAFLLFNCALHVCFSSPPLGISLP